MTGPSVVTPERSAILPGAVLGAGIAAALDGIVFHQLLQWHHMGSSAGYPVTSLWNLQVNTYLDGLFHALALVLLLVGFALTLRAGLATTAWRSLRFAGSLLLGIGSFNVAEGLVNHHLLAIHHVNETVPAEQQVYWDVGFLAVNAAIAVLGWAMLRPSLKNAANVP